jgi:hypothetical protein
MTFLAVLFGHQQTQIVVEQLISLVITVPAQGAFRCIFLIGEVAEFKASVQKLAQSHLYFPLGVELREDASVPAQDVIDVAHVIGCVAVEPVVKCCAALVTAEFLVGPAGNAITAFLAGLGVFHCNHGGCR